MGVPGLTSFVDENNHLLKDLKLHDCRIIIDGNNLYHFLYYYFKIPTQFAGDYSQFETNIRYFFNTLKTCGIESYVVFDGSLEERKIGTCLKRARNRLAIAESLSIGRNGKILPVLAYQTFQHVLSDIGVANATCDFEADGEIAALASQWKCPVLTNDSDFFIYDLEGGYIVLDYLNLRLHTHKPKEGEEGHEYRYLKVQIYYLDTLLSQLSTMEKKMIPLFATLIGNDFVKTQVFEVFFAGVKFQKPSTDQLFASRRFTKMVSLLQWLEYMETFDNAVEKVLEHFPSGKRAQINDVIKRCVNSYTELSTNLAEYFEGVEPSSQLKSHRGVTLPDWFIRRLRRGELSVMVIMNALVKRKVIFLSQVERMNDPSVFLCATTIRKAIYAILLSIDLEYESDSSLCVAEYDREGKNQKCTQVTPVYELECGVKLPSLRAVPDIATHERAALLLAVLGIEKEVLDLVPADAKLVVAALVYWARNSSPKVKEFHLMAMLLCLLKFWAVDQLVSDDALSAGDNSPQDAAQEAQGQDAGKVSELVSSVSTACSLDDLQKASECLEHFTAAPRLRKPNLFDNTIVHAYSQFQACFLAALYLNQVLCDPYPRPNPARFCNGTFFYNVTRALKARKAPRPYLDELLDSSPSLSQYHRRLCSTVCGALPPDIFLSGKQKKKKKCKDKKGKAAAAADGPDSDTNDIDEKDTGVEVVCDLANRFDCLQLQQNVDHE